MSTQRLLRTLIVILIIRLTDMIRVLFHSKLTTAPHSNTCVKIDRVVANIMILIAGTMTFQVSLAGSGSFIDTKM